MPVFIGLRVLLKRIKAIRFMMVDRSVSFGKKLLVVIGIVYLFLPVDLIPPVIFPIAWVDDLILWIFILWYLRETLDRYWKGEKSVDYSGKYKNVYDDVEFEVHEGKDKNKEKESEEDSDPGRRAV